jgi:hypothetical protein
MAAFERDHLKLWEANPEWSAEKVAVKHLERRSRRKARPA